MANAHAVAGVAGQDHASAPAMPLCLPRIAAGHSDCPSGTIVADVVIQRIVVAHIACAGACPNLCRRAGLFISPPRLQNGQPERVEQQRHERDNGERARLRERPARRHAGEGRRDHDVEARQRQREDPEGQQYDSSGE